MSKSCRITFTLEFHVLLGFVDVYLQLSAEEPEGNLPIQVLGNVMEYCYNGLLCFACSAILLQDRLELRSRTSLGVVRLSRWPLVT